MIRWVIQKTCATFSTNQKLKPILTWSTAFSRALGGLLVLTLSSHWFLVILSVVLIGYWDYFRFCSTTLNRKCALKQATASEITTTRNKTYMFHGKKYILSKKSFRKTNEKAPKWLIPDKKLCQSDWRIPVSKLTDFH